MKKERQENDEELGGTPDTQEDLASPPDGACKRCRLEEGRGRGELTHLHKDLYGRESWVSLHKTRPNVDWGQGCLDLTSLRFHTQMAPARQPFAEYCSSVYGLEHPFLIVVPRPFTF